jgi:hypothetical protein
MAPAERKPHGKRALRQRIAQLQDENEALRAELLSQWESNHAEHCAASPGLTNAVVAGRFPQD